MKLLWLGQNGLLFDFDGTKIMIDPYLTDSLSKEDRFFTRRIKTNRKLYKAKPDVIVLTNEHLDHADNESLEKLLKHTGKKKRTIILSSESVYEDIIALPSLSFANHIMFEKNSEWTINNVNIRAVPAKTDDRTAFGVVITDFSNGKKYYIAGDTLYNSYVLDNIPDDIYASFLPINGEFGSMNVTDAKRVASRVKSRFCVPVHFGMFDKVDPKLFDLPNTIIPKPYKIINFDDYESTVPNPYKVEVTEEVAAVKEIEEQTDNEVALLPVSNDVMPVDEMQIDNIQVEEPIEVVDLNDTDNNSIVDNVNEDISVVSTETDENEVLCEVVNEEIIEINEIDNEVNTNEHANSMIGENSETQSNDDETFENTEKEPIDFEITDTSNEKFDDAVTEIIENNDENTSKSKVMNDSEKIDAYIKEIEKFERGETTDFSTIDDDCK